MIGRKQIEERLSKTFCYRCGGSLDGAKFTPISEIPVATIAQVVCPQCKTESMVTITASDQDAGVSQIISDLNAAELKKFANYKSVSYDEVLDLHKLLKKKSLWKLLQKKEKNSVKRQNPSEGKEKSLQ